jgi:hypothetical protein
MDMLVLKFSVAAANQVQNPVLMSLQNIAANKRNPAKEVKCRKQTVREIDALVGYSGTSLSAYQSNG